MKPLSLFSFVHRRPFTDESDTVPEYNMLCETETKHLNFDVIQACSFQLCRLWIRGAGTVSGHSGQIFLENAPIFLSLSTLVFSLPTLDLITWVGKDPPAIT